MKTYGQSIENTYTLLSGAATLDQLLMYICFIVVKDGEDFPEDMLPVFFIEPGEKPTIDDIDEMIKYFEKQEDDLHVFDSVQKGLKSKGLFVFDYLQCLHLKQLILLVLEQLPHRVNLNL